MDEIGFSVKSISDDGKLVVETLGGMDLSFYEGHPMLVHTATGDRDAIMELPHGWDEQNFKWPAESDQDDPSRRRRAQLRRSRETRHQGRRLDHHSQGISPSARHARQRPQLRRPRRRHRALIWRRECSVRCGRSPAQGPRRHLRLVHGRGNRPRRRGRAGETPRRGRPHAGLRLRRGHVRQLGFAARIEALRRCGTRQRFRDPRRGQLQHRPARSRRESCKARARESDSRAIRRHLGGNDGATFVPYGAVDIALGWPLRYSHSPAEVIDTRDVDALARIVAVIARSW